MRIIIENRNNDGIPALDIYNPDCSDKLPIILMLHGFEGCKEYNLLDAYRFAKEGYFVVTFDAFSHGELMDDDFKKLTRVEKERYFWSIVLRTAQVINTLIDGYKYNEKCDYRRVGLIGQSMGGLIIYSYLTGDRHPNVKAAVPMIATPAWVNLDQEYYRRNEEAMRFYNEEESGLIERIEPYQRLNSLKDLPLLMLNGVKDPEMPIVDVRRSFFEMQQIYRNKERVRLVEYAEIGHRVTAEMINQALIWFGKYL